MIFFTRLKACFALVLVGTKSLCSAVLTVDNNPGSAAMFTTGEAAYAAAQNGDTLLFSGSDAPYNIPDIKKAVSIQGPGYLLGENTIPGVSSKPAILSSLNVSQDPTISNGGTVTIRGIYMGPYGSALLSGPAVVMEKCKLGTVNIYGSAKISRSLIGEINTTYGQPGALISNCVIGRLNLNTQVFVTHCVVLYTVTYPSNVAVNPSISDTIFVDAKFSPTPPFPGSITNCLSLDSYLPPGTGNITAATNVFTVSGGTEDSKWRLSPDSPARGAGSGGTDIGAFGGVAPYVLSGVPGMPRITRLSVPATATSSSGLLIEVEAQAFTE